MKSPNCILKVPQLLYKVHLQFLVNVGIAQATESDGWQVGLFLVDDTSFSVGGVVDVLDEAKYQLVDQHPQQNCQHYHKQDGFKVAHALVVA